MDLTEKTVSELEAPVVDMDVDRSAVDSNIDKKYNRGRVHVHARAMMPEKQMLKLDNGSKVAFMFKCLEENMLSL